jgi:hypothetical protein
MSIKIRFVTLVLAACLLCKECINILAKNGDSAPILCIMYVLPHADVETDTKTLRAYIAACPHLNREGIPSDSLYEMPVYAYLTIFWKVA